MKLTRIILTIAALSACTFLTVSALAAPPAAPTSASFGAVTPEVAALLAMPREARNAHLRSLDPSERRGLWMQVKHAQLAQRGQQPKARGTGMVPKTIEGANTPAWQLAVGTISYDSGPPSVSFGGGSIVGNRFDTHTGIPVLTNGQVSTVQAVVVQGPAFSSDSAGFVLLGPQTGGGGAAAIFSTFTTGMTAATETVSFTGIGAGGAYTGSSFFVLFGDFASVYVPPFGTGSTNAQGHHGVVGYTGGQGPNITGTFNFGGTLNGFVRATGNIVPVELMSFDVK